MENKFNKSELIEEKQKIIFENLITDYNHGKIKTEIELLYRIYNAFEEFYSSIGKPTFKFNEAKNTPVSSHYNNMVQDFINDITLIINDNINLTNLLNQSFIETELDRKMLLNQIRYLYKNIDKIKSTAGSIHNEVIFSDTFINANNIDMDFIKNTPVSINKTEGVITLNKIESKEYYNDCTIEILQGSNGFPGNTHIANTLNGELNYDGENGLHLSLSDIIDNNLDTWFEYEIFNIDYDTYEKTAGIGFNYKENVSWLIENDRLILNLRITMNNPQTCNWLSLTPFIPDHKGAVASSIKRIIISDGKGQIQNIVNNKRIFDDDLIYIFKSQTVKTISIELEQQYYYDVDIIHLYYTEVIGKEELFFNNNTELNNRIDGEYPSIELLGMSYDSKTKQIVHQNKNSNIFDETVIKNNLLLFTNNNKESKLNRELLKANRYHIGIKNINISNYNFGTSSEYISKLYTSKNKIETISIDVEDYVSSSYGDGEWIKYYISIDDTTWYQINPINKSYLGKALYYINSRTTFSLRNSLSSYIDVNYDVYNIRFKISITRPDSIEFINTTPIVYSYNIKITTGE